MSSEKKQEFHKKFINQILRITTQNGRILEGKLKSIDFRGNIVLQDGIAEIP